MDNFMDILTVYQNENFPEGMAAEKTRLLEKYPEYEFPKIDEIFEIATDGVSWRNDNAIDFYKLELIGVIEFFTELIKYSFSSSEYFRAMGGKKSAKKAETSKVNGALGGRPKSNSHSCIYCNSDATVRNGHSKSNAQIFLCRSCKKTFTVHEPTSVGSN